MTWYAMSMGFIKQQKPRNPDMSRNELRKYCSKNYPFSERRGYEYEAFLQAMRDTRRAKPRSQQELGIKLEQSNKQSKATRGRKPLPPDLPRVRIEHDLSEAEQLCPCGCQRTIIDEDSSE